jgi:polyisoprenoid-binding protein YceI
MSAASTWLTVASSAQHGHRAGGGLFTDFQGTVESTGEHGGMRASGTVEVASLDTRSAQRDQHLRAAEFCDLENHPRITFESTRIEPRGDGLRVVGNLSIKGVAR